MRAVTTRLDHLRTLSAQIEQTEHELAVLFPVTGEPRIREVLVYGSDAGMEGRHFMTVDEVANTVALHPKVVRRAIDAGELKAFKLRSRIRIKRSDFNAWLEANRVEPYPIPELEP
jgi:excisionase family DNA binding protein